jgi:exopolysaccharide production protein ExoQ
MIQSRSAILWGRTASASSTRSVPSPPSANIERWFIVCVFVLMGVSAWFTGAEGDDDIMRGSSLAQLLWSIVYLAAVIGLLRNRNKLSQLMRFSLPIIAIVALATISTAWSIDPSITLKRAFGLFGTTAFGYYIVSRFKLEDFIDIFGVTCYVVIALSLLAVFLVPSIGVMQNEYVGAWRGIFNHKNTFGEFMALAFVTFATILLSKAWRRGIAATGVLLAVLLIIQSRSVTAWFVSLIVAFAIGLAVLYRHSVRGRRVALAVGAVMLVAALALLAYDGNGQALLGLVGRDDTLTGRADFWPEVVQAVSFHPLLGYGYGAFWLPNGDFSYFIHSGVIPAHAHNGYLEACLDIGMLGSAIGVLAILIAMRRGAALFAQPFTHRHTWPFLTTIYFLVINLTESSIAKYNNFNWIIFVIAFLYASQCVAMLSNRRRAAEERSMRGMANYRNAAAVASSTSPRALLQSRVAPRLRSPFLRLIRVRRPSC